MNQISIITICFNNLEELIKTCRSIETQEHKPYEHIIIDGSTNEDIKNYLATHTQPTYRKWLSEADKGISDAFNKGLMLATGNIIAYLNSGDIYYDNTILKLVQSTFIDNPSLQWVHGMLNMQRSGQWVLIGKPFEEKKVYRGMRSTFHPTMFVRKELFTTYSSFNLSYKIAMDYDFLVRIRHEKFAFINKPIVTFDPHGISNSRYVEGLQETRRAYETHVGRSWKLVLWQMRLKALHYLLSSPIGNFLYRLKKMLGKENW